MNTMRAGLCSYPPSSFVILCTTFVTDHQNKTIMALIQMSGGFSAIIGKMKGNVFSRYGSNTMLRSNKNWNRRGSVNWQNQKQRISTVSAAWRALTDADRTAWEAMTVNYPTTDPFGNPRIPSGYELFMRLNLVLNFNGVALLSNPLAPVALTDIGTFSVGGGGGVGVFPTWVNLTTADEVIEFFGMPRTSAGKKFPAGGWRWLGTYTLTAFTTYDLTNAYQAAYGNLVSLGTYNVKAILCNKVTGQQANPVYARITEP